MLRAQWDDLCCPSCHGALHAVTGPPGAEISGLRCPSHGEYPICNGMPSFAHESSAEFDEHWTEHADRSLPPAKLAAASRFLAPVLGRATSGGRLRCLDAGCGDGAHLAVLGAQREQTFELTGLDISPAALQRAHGNLPFPWRPVHGDVCALPFRDDSFDITLSFGVLAYTSRPWHGLAELFRVTKPGGLVGVWFAPRRGGIADVLLRSVRALAGRLPPVLRPRLADLIVPFLSIISTASGVSLRNASWCQCREVVLVNIAPTTLMFPTEGEAERHIVDLGACIIDRDPQQPIALWAEKPANGG